MRNGGCNQSTALHFFCIFHLTLLPCCSVESLPCDTVLQKPLQHGSFPWAAAKNCSSMRRFCGHSSSRKGCSSTGPSSYSSCREAAPAQAFHGCIFLQDITTALVWGPPQAVAQRSVPMWSTTNCRGRACSTVVFTDCRALL